MKYVSNVGPSTLTPLSEFYNIITSESYNKDFKNFTLTTVYQPEWFQVLRTLNKYIQQEGIIDHEWRRRNR